MTLKWSKLALADLANARGYIARERPLAAARVVDRIETAIGALTDHPEIGRPGRVAGTRELVVAGTPFVVPYRIKGSRIELLAVLHASRRWPDSF